MANLFNLNANGGNDKHIQVAILAGGLATRLGELAQDRPKSLIPIAGKPFLEHQIDFLRDRGVRDIVLLLGHLGKQVEGHFGDGSRFGVELKYSYEARPLGTAGALKNAEGLLGDIFFTLYGDSYVFLDFATCLAHFTARDRLGLMSVYKNLNRYDRSNTVVRDGIVTAYDKQVRRPEMVYIEYGANILRKEALRLLPDIRPYGLEDLFPKLVGMGELLAYEEKERFYEIGSIPGLMEFSAYIERVR